MNRLTSLQAKMPLLIIGALVVPLVLFAVFGYSQAKTYFVQQKLGDMMNIIDTKYIHILDYLDRGKAEITALSANPSVLAAFSPESSSDVARVSPSAFLSKTVESNKITGKHSTNKSVPTRSRYGELLVVDNDGLVIASSKSASIGSQVAMDYPKGEAGVIDAHESHDGQVVFGFSAPIMDKGKKQGNLVAMIDVGLLEMIMTGEIGNVTGGELYFAGYSDSLDFYIMNEEGYMITQSRALKEDTALKVKGSAAPLKRALDTEAEGTRVTGAGLETGAREVMEVYEDYEGKQVAAASMVIFELLWTVVIEDDVNEAFAPLFRLRNILGVALLVVALMSGLAGIIFSIRTTRPILSLVASAEKIAEGDLDETVESTRTDEIGRLSEAFNKMTTTLRLKIKAEKEAKEHLEHTVTRYTEFIDQVKEGDLAARLSINGHQDDLSLLGNNLNTMVGSLGHLVRDIQDASSNIASASTQIYSASSQHSAGATQQAASISETTATVDEVRKIAEETTGRAQSVADAAQKSAAISDTGLAAVEQTVSGMGQIKDKVEQIAGNIMALSEQSQQISNIITTVNDIAEQSNLLALNASIEAARAGDQGKGFAVVATEVRNLAEQSQQATSQVKAILDDIQKATNTVVIVTEEGTRGVEEGMGRATQAGNTIRALATAIGAAAESTQQIVASAQQQSAGMDQIARAMSDINEGTSQTLASNKQTESAVADLSTLGDDLGRTISKYKTGETKIAELIK